MNTRISKIGSCVFLAALSTILLACGTTPNPNLYVLEPIQKLGTTADTENYTYLVGPIVVAEHLNRPEIVNRDTRYRVAVDPLERWAEPLDEGVLRTVAENLTALLNTERVVMYPWAFTNIADFVVRANIHEFGPKSADEVVLDVSWMIGDGKGKVLTLRRSSYAGTRSGNSNAATAAAMSDALGDMSRDIAETLRTHTVTSD